jgi:hypothetical protein
VHVYVARIATLCALVFSYKFESGVCAIVDNVIVVSLVVNRLKQCPPLVCSFAPFIITVAVAPAQSGVF